MTDETRRTVDEIIARYEVEPSLRDVYVEGWFDVRVIDWFARQIEARDIAVYEIDSVEIGANELVKANLVDNTRSRVIWLAQRLSGSLGHDAQCVVCVVDRDEEIFTGPSIQCGLLLYTDHTSMEVYFFNHDILTKAINISAGIRVDVAAAISSMSVILARLFAMRCANLLMKWGMEWLEPVKCLRLNGGAIAFDEERFVERYLNKNGRAGDKAEFMLTVEELSSNICVQVPLRGHDAFMMLGWYLAKQNVKQQFCDSSVLLALAVGCATADYLSKHEMFQELSRRLLQ